MRHRGLRVFDVGRVLTAAGSLLAVSGVLIAQGWVAERASAATARAAGERLTIATRTFKMSGPDEKQRLVVRCPGRTTPLGGGMITNPPPSGDGEGVYPHSYERLGRQRGWHVTPVHFDPSRGATQARDVTLQVVCERKRKHVTPPHATVTIRPGQTKTAQATCPGRRRLFGGGFQRTDFTSEGGNYVTVSRAISPRTWQVTGRAFGSFGGKLTAIAYCRRSRKPLVTEVSASTVVAPGSYGTATTPPCPAGRRLVFGGFSSEPAGPVFLTDGHISPEGAWTASGFNFFGPTATVSAYGYCHRV
jgi:hypothetical protein